MRVTSPYLHLSPCRILHAVLAAGLLFGLAGQASEAEGGSESSAQGDLQRIEGVVYLDEEWNDGDSFRVRFPGGEVHTLRLYGVDCIETDVGNETEARRVRDQRRHFGIANREVTESVRLALDYGRLATERVRELLDEPFTVHTSFADGRGDPRYARIYAFVTTAGGRDLSEQLVEEGLARAFGVARRTPSGLSQEEFRQALADLETVALATRRGVWAETDWESLPAQRREQRREIEELAAAVEAAKPDFSELRINPNNAARRELELLPGIGEVRALQIIEGRAQGAYRSPEDLLRLHGFGPAMLDRIREALVFE